MSETTKTEASSSVLSDNSQSRVYVELSHGFSSANHRKEARTGADETAEKGPQHEMKEHTGNTLLETCRFCPSVPVSHAL